MDRKKEEFLKIIEGNKRIIFKVCNSYCKNTSDQQDLFQDIVVQLWKSFEKYDKHYKVTTWMYRIALNVAISSYRKTVTRNKHTPLLGKEFVEIAEEENEEYQEEDIKHLQKFIDGLDELNKALIILYLESHSHNEIAKILNISTSNVGTKIGRIKQKLKEYFKNISE